MLKMAYKILLFVVFLVSCAKGQSIEGDRCTDASSGMQGVCMNIKRCQTAISALPNKRPQVCSFSGMDQVVCCMDRVTTSTQRPSATTEHIPPANDYVDSSAAKQSADDYAPIPANQTVRKTGDVCSLNIENRSFPGVCKIFWKCPYALKLFFEDKKVPPMCGWDDDVRIVCCPIKNLGFRTGIHGRLYDPTSDGVKRSEAATCRYDGTQHLCCPNKPDIPLPDEAGCPPLDIPSPPPRLTAIERIAWNKCVETQRFVHRCVAKKDDSEWLTRVDTCKIPQNKLRISGGVPAVPMEFPHMAVLGVVENSDDSEDDVDWVAGGSLISDRFILTAAHVLIDPLLRPLRYALLGTLNKTDIHNGLLYNIVRMIPYPLYNHNSLHDIALLELDRRVTFSESVRPICLPVPGQVVLGDVRDIAGWGQTSEDADPSQILHTTQVLLLESDASECKPIANRNAGSRNANKFHFNSTTMICALGRIGNQVSSGPCRGDGGAPLMGLLENIYCSYSVEGVVSFGPRRCGTGSAGVYTRVEHYLPWIVEQVWPQEYAETMGAGKFD